MTVSIPPRTRNFLAGFLTGLTVSAVNLKLDPNGPQWIVSLVLTLFALSFAAARPLAAWVCSIGIALGPLAVAGFVNRRFSIGLALALLAGAPACILGGFSGRLFKRFWLPGVVAAIPALAGIALLVFTPAIVSYRQAAQLQKREHAVLNKLKSLREAELSFAAGTPDRHYTCEGPELPGTNSDAWFTYVPAGAPRKEWLIDHGYLFHLECSGAVEPVAFRIVAYPAPHGKDGGRAFCIGLSGAIQIADRADELTCTQ